MTQELKPNGSGLESALLDPRSQAMLDVAT